MSPSTRAELCVYCHTDAPRTKGEHVTPQALGMFEHNWTLECIMVKHLESSKNIGPDDFVFCRSDDDPRPHDLDELRRVLLYPVLDRCGIKRTPRADGFHAFRRAASKYLRKAGGLELAAVQLGHKRMTTTDEHYNDRDMDDLKRAAELIECVKHRNNQQQKYQKMNKDLLP